MANSPTPQNKDTNYGLDPKQKAAAAAAAAADPAGSTAAAPVKKAGKGRSKEATARRAAKRNRDVEQQVCR